MLGANFRAHWLFHLFRANIQTIFVLARFRKSCWSISWVCICVHLSTYRSEICIHIWCTHTPWQKTLRKWRHLQRNSGTILGILRNSEFNSCKNLIYLKKRESNDGDSSFHKRLWNILVLAAEILAVKWLKMECS